jgi:hypothetical protein
MNDETLQNLKEFGFKLHEESANYLVLRERVFAWRSRIIPALELMKVHQWELICYSNQFLDYIFKKVPK